MTNATGSNRRQFLAVAAGAGALAVTARSYGRVMGANERIRIAQIGCGNRGFAAHMAGIHKHAEAKNVEIVAVCDVWRPYRERAVEQVRQWYGRKPFATTKYEEIMARDDIDAVMIATPDHQHCLHLKAAALAGKDAYCEKPLSMDLDELKDTCDAVKRAGIVVQIGTQSRSYPAMLGCRKAYQQGLLGRVSRVEQFRNGSKPNWYKRLDRLPIKKADVDWAEFLKPRPMRPFSDVLFAGWYGYREFCSGSIGQFMSHFIDLVHFITGATYPSCAVAMGDTFIWKDKYKFDCCDQVETTLIYPEGFMVHYCTNFGNGYGSRTLMYGTRGIMEFHHRQRASLSGQGASERGKLGKEQPVEKIECPDHFLNWLQCLRTRKAPVAPIEAGYQHSIACILSDQARKTGQRQVYDREKREIRAG
ncbi:MAG: Gfo/Idh/MocA family oxidoreductase [Planctomycetes bacterium]|nr:Gfo/Idh/MocA family oxidoreductase [Planctomycetota bacterium]